MPALTGAGDVSGGGGPGGGDPEGGIDDPKGEPPNLRDVALKGGTFLIIREAIGMLIRLGGVVVVTRLIGPHQYGIYVGAVAVTVLVASVSQLGAEVWLIRKDEPPSAETYNQCFSTLVVVSLVVVSVSLGLSWPVGMVIHNSRELLVFRLLLISVPVNILWAPAQAKLERQFQYRRMAWLEIVGDVVLYGVAVPLAFLGFGVWAPTLGFIAWQTVLFVGSAALAGLTPRWNWSAPTARAIIRNGITYSSSNWIDRLAALANPVIVGGLVGATGVGVVGLALRLVDTAGFALRAAWRLGMATISRIQHDPERLKGAMEDGMLAQSLTLGAPMAALAVVSPWIIPFVFGHAWAAASAVYGVLAFSRLVSSVSLPQMTLLFAQGRNAIVATALAVNAVLLAGMSVLFVHLDGVLGYGWATLTSAAAWIILDRVVRRETGFTYWRCLPAMIALGIPMLAPLAPWPWRLALCAPVGLIIVVADTRRSVLGYARVGLSGLLPGRSST